MKSKKNLLPVIVSIVTLLYVVSCSSKKDNVDPPGPPGGNDCATASAKFTADVLPIIQTRCSGASNCHGAGSSSGPGELLTFAQISTAKAAINDAAVVNNRMPKGGAPLTAAQKLAIKCWIASGAPNN